MKYLCFSALVLLTVHALCAQLVVPGHSHNDYEQAEPLNLALENRMRSVEADVHLVGEQLLVAHDLDEVDSERTIQSLYLEPLIGWIAQRDGSVYSSGEEMILLVDIKSEATTTYLRLEEILSDFGSMLTKVVDGQIQTNAVRVVISGNRPVELMRQQTSRLAFLDGRVPDLDSEVASSFMPLISDNWRNHFTWNGEGIMPEAEFEKLQALVQSAHAQKKWIRFWAAPDTEVSWDTQRRSGVDLINTDHPNALKKFLSQSDR